MLYIDRLKLIKSMIIAKDDDTMFYVDGYSVGGVKIGDMNYGGMKIGGISLDDEHEFEREEVSEFMLEEIEN